MPRPESVTLQDVERWSNNIDQDNNLPQALVKSPIVREVCYAGLWLAEELEKVHCPDALIIRIQWHAGKLSFGRDTWEVHQQLLNDYKNNKLEFEEEPNLDIN